MSLEQLEQVKGIEGQSVDLWKFDKTTTKIDKVEVVQVPSQYTPLIEGTEEHHKQWVLKVESEVLTSIGEGDEKIDFRASELFNLVQNDKGELQGFPKGEGSNLMKFAKDLRIDTTNIDNLKVLIESIKSKDTLVKAYDKEVEGNKKTYLKFRY